MSMLPLNEPTRIKLEGECRVVLVSSPKGGSGKSVISRHLLVCAAQVGVKAIGLDFDRQQTFSKWAERRKRTRDAFPDFVPIEVAAASLQDWRGALRSVAGFQLAILDTPPSVEEHLPAIEGLSEAADLILVPAICTQDDVDSIAPWMRALSKNGYRCAVILNRANRRTTSYGRMRGVLIKAGPVCPTELPQLEDIHVPASKGLTLLDYSKSRGIEPFEEIWAYVRREVKL